MNPWSGHSKCMIHMVFSGNRHQPTVLCFLLRVPWWICCVVLVRNHLTENTVIREAPRPQLRQPEDTCDSQLRTQVRAEGEETRFFVLRHTVAVCPCPLPMRILVVASTLALKFTPKVWRNWFFCGQNASEVLDLYVHRPLSRVREIESYSGLVISDPDRKTEEAEKARAGEEANAAFHLWNHKPPCLILVFQGLPTSSCFVIKMNTFGIFYVVGLFVFSHKHLEISQYLCLLFTFFLTIA